MTRQAMIMLTMTTEVNKRGLYLFGLIVIVYSVIACIVMAHMPVASTAMAYIVMAYMLAASIAMAYIGMAK